jgi:transcriptional regulator with XRE-family HTH domain
MPGKPPASPPPITMTPNQVVAYNLARARQWRGWTQEQAAEALEPYLGARWSKATFSAAERSVDGRTIRQFSADDLVAFSRCFQVPLSWFFMPPAPDERREQGVTIRLDVPDAPQTGADLALLLDLVFGEPHQEPLVGLRLEEYLDELEPRPPTEGERRAADNAAHKLAALVRAGSDGIDQWQEQLREIATHLENVIALASIAAWGDPGEAAQAKEQARKLAEPRPRYEPARAAPPAPPRKRPRTA